MKCLTIRNTSTSPLQFPTIIRGNFSKCHYEAASPCKVGSALRHHWKAAHKLTVESTGEVRSDSTVIVAKKAPRLRLVLKSGMW